jgi:hypothetical protein
MYLDGVALAADAGNSMNGNCSALSDAGVPLDVIDSRDTSVTPSSFGTLQFYNRVVTSSEIALISDDPFYPWRLGATSGGASVTAFNVLFGSLQPPLVHAAPRCTNLSYRERQTKRQKCLSGRGGVCFSLLIAVVP